MRSRALLLIVLIAPGCLSAGVAKVDDSLRERIDQVAKEADEKLKKVEVIVNDVRKSTDKFVDESAAWREQSQAWKEEADKFVAVAKDYREESRHWQEQSDLWRTFFEAETKKNRDFLAAQQEKGTKDLNALVDRLPEVLKEAASNGIKSSGLPAKQNDDGSWSINWALIGAGLVSFVTAIWQIFRVRSNAKKGKKRHTDGEVQDLASRVVEARLKGLGHPPKG